MSYFDEASLVMIPSGYKTSKVYSVLPTDGSGDLTFSRSNDTATRVNSDGLIEKVRTNLLTYSNDFSNAAWTKVGGTTLTAGQSDYLGGTNAWKWEATGTGTIQLAQNPAGATIRAASIYAKAGSVSTLNLWIGSAVTFNLSTGTVTSGTGVITSVGNGWYRCSAFGTGISHNPYFAAATAGDYLLISFAQVDEGDIATDYIPTTSAAVSVGPVANLPRLDYLDSSCPRLLLEPQRTNLITYSEQFDNAAWTKSNATITPNTSVSPDGYTSADTLTVSVSGYLYFSVGSYSAVSGQSVTLSVFAKNQTTDFLRFGGATEVGTDIYKIENYGNGWYRHSVTRTFSATSSTLLQYIIGNVGTHIIWGAQIEGSNSAYVTSYIPTLGASVTRGADAASKTGITSLIGQTEGTMYWEGQNFGLEGVSQESIPFALFSTASGSADQRYFAFRSGGQIQFIEYASGATQASIIGGSFTEGQTLKIAAGYKQNDFVLYINGVQIGTDTSGNVGACTLLDMRYLGLGLLAQAKTAQAILFKTRLSNADLANLTSL